MSNENQMNADMHRILDGERAEDGDTHAQAAAAQFQNAVDAYVTGLNVPGREVDWAVMKVIRARQGKMRSFGWWSWLVQPRMVRLRPALAAAAVVAAVGLGVALRQVTLSNVPGVSSETPVVLVRFELPAPAAQAVSVVGSFNDWNPIGHRMAVSSATGLWTITLPLPSGEHQYLFVVDGEQWVPDPGAHAQVDDGFGMTNSVIVVGPRGVARS